MESAGVLKYVPSSKRKRVVLSLKEKLEIIEKLKKGESTSKLSAEYSVGRSTIHDVRKNGENIANFVAEGEKTEQLMRKSMKKAENAELEEAVYKWYKVKEICGNTITGSMLCEKALDINKKLNTNPSFKASSGWLKNFKRRHGISLSSDQSSTKARFRNIWHNTGYDANNIYRADIIGLKWKSLPEKLTAALGHPINEDCIAVFTCANADGSHKLPLLVIGRSNITMGESSSSFPFVYSISVHAWLDNDTFCEWYNNVFIEEVNTFHENTGSYGPSLLCLDNCLSYLNHDKFEKREDFTIGVLPAQTVSVNAPNAQLLFMQAYRKRFLHQLVHDSGDDDYSFSACYKKVGLENALCTLSEAWDSLPNTMISRGWIELLSVSVTNEPHSAEESLFVDAFPVKELVSMTKNIPDCLDCCEEDVTKWLVSDYCIPVFHSPEKPSKSETAKDVSTENVPSHSDALSAFKTVFQWLKGQKECNAVHVAFMKMLCDLASKKADLELKASNAKSILP